MPMAYTYSQMKMILFSILAKPELSEQMANSNFII